MKPLESYTQNLLRTFSTFSVIILILFFLASCGSSGDKAKVADQESTKVAQSDTTTAQPKVATVPEQPQTATEPTTTVTSSEKLASGKPKTTNAPLPKDPVTKKDPEPVTVEKKQEPVEVVTPTAKTEIVTKVPEKVPAEPFIKPATSWPVPAKYSAMKNPSPGQKESIALGKELYNKHCKSCHGASGKGDGTKAASLSAQIRSFQSSAVKAQKAGDIYYKSFVGKNEMPNFEKKITDDEDRWGIVNYILSL
jgi:mono/diheme cytochrome c family protein